MPRPPASNSPTADPVDASSPGGSAAASGEPRQGGAAARVRVRLGASRFIDIAPGAMVLVRHGDNDSFGAMVAKVERTSALLTFTPVHMPRRVPLGLILCAVGAGDATVDMSSVPRYQPEPTVVARRSRKNSSQEAG